MRKIMALGLSAVSAATFAFTAAAPAAHANVVTDVCNLIPGIVSSNNSAVAKAAVDSGAADVALAATAANLTAATTAFTAAVVTQLTTVAAGLDSSVTTAALNVASTNVNKALTDWSVANATAYGAHQSERVLLMQQSIISGIAGLC